MKKFSDSAMACSSTNDTPSDVPVSRLRRWSSIGVRSRTASFDNRVVRVPLINITLIR